MEKQLHIKILEYLKDQNAITAKIEIGAPFLLDDDSTAIRRELCLALDYLKKENFINLTGKPAYLLNTQGGQHDSKYSTGLMASITKLGEKEIEPAIASLPVEKHIITNHYHLDNSVNSIVGNKNSQSFKDQTVNNTNSIATNTTNSNPTMKWILATISAIVASLIVWYLTKP